MNNRIKTAPAAQIEGLKLRLHQKRNFEFLSNLWRESVVYRHLTRRPSTLKESWTRLLRYIGHWAVLGFGYRGLTVSTRSTYLGEIGLADFRRSADVPITEGPELGWVMRPAVRGKGHSTAALKAKLSWSDRNLARTDTFCLICPENLASIHVHGKVGCTGGSRIIYHNEMTIVFTLRAKGTGM